MRSCWQSRAPSGMVIRLQALDVRGRSPVPSPDSLSVRISVRTGDRLNSGSWPWLSRPGIAGALDSTRQQTRSSRRAATSLQPKRTYDSPWENLSPGVRGFDPLVLCRPCTVCCFRSGCLDNRALAGGGGTALPRAWRGAVCPRPLPALGQATRLAHSTWGDHCFDPSCSGPLGHPTVVR